MDLSLGNERGTSAVIQEPAVDAIDGHAALLNLSAQNSEVGYCPWHSVALVVPYYSLSGSLPAARPLEISSANFGD
jgi:hypothetical protein